MYLGGGGGGWKAVRKHTLANSLAYVQQQQIKQ